MCIKKSKLSSRIVAMILSALTSLFSVGAMHNDLEEYDLLPLDTNYNNTNDIEVLWENNQIINDEFSKTNSDEYRERLKSIKSIKELNKEIDFLNGIHDSIENENDDAINDFNKKAKLVNIRYNELIGKGVNIPSQDPNSENIQLDQSGSIIKEDDFNLEDSANFEHYIPMSDSVINFNNLGESANIAVEELRDMKKNNELPSYDPNCPILDKIPNFEEEIKSSNLNIGKIIPGASTDTKFLDSSDMTALNLIYDKNNNQVLEENEQLANNTLNNVGTSNNQYSNEVISSNAHAEDYSSYEDYVTSEFILQYNPDKPIIRTQFDRNIKAKIDEIIDSKHYFRLYKIRVGDTVVCVVIKDLTDRCAFKYLDKGQLLQEIGSLMYQWDGILSCVINSIKSIVNLDGNLVSNKTQESNDSKFNYEVSKLL